MGVYILLKQIVLTPSRGIYIIEIDRPNRVYIFLKQIALTPFRGIYIIETDRPNTLQGYIYY